MMFDHIGIRVSDLGRSLDFYDAVLKPLGYVRCSSDDSGAGYGPPGRPTFWISLAGQTGIGTHIAFAADSEAAVGAFHHAGLKSGARDNGAPGPRPDYGSGYFAAFLIDPDDNNIEAVHMAEAAS